MSHYETNTEFIPTINLNNKQYISSKNKYEDAKNYNTEYASDEIPRATKNLPEIEEIRNMSKFNRKKLGINYDN